MKTFPTGVFLAELLNAGYLEVIRNMEPAENKYPMHEIRIHGRGGQGGVVAANILAHSLFKEGKHVQAFPHFGVERRGAPVAAFVRFDNQPISLRCHIYEPDYVIILDPTLAGSDSVTAGLRDGGKLLVNSTSTGIIDLHGRDVETAAVDAASIAAGLGLGTVSSPIVNTAILGAFARFSGIVKLETLTEVVGELIEKKTNNNIEAMKLSYDNLITEN